MDKLVILFFLPEWLLRIFTALLRRSVALEVRCFDASFCLDFWDARRAFICGRLTPLGQERGLVRRRADRVRVISRELGSSPCSSTTIMSSSSSAPVSLGASDDPVEPVDGLGTTSSSDPKVKAGCTSPPTTTQSSSWSLGDTRWSPPIDGTPFSEVGSSVEPKMEVAK